MKRPDAARIRILPCLVAALLSAATLAIADSFVVDPNSSSWASTADVLTDVGSSPGMPRLAIPASALGLDPDDVIDAISDGADDIADLPPGIVDSLTRRHAILFSVRRQSSGWTGTGVEAERQADTAPPVGGAPFGHASDIFISDGTSNTNALVTAPDGWGIENGDATVEPRDDGIHVTGDGEYGVAIDLPASRSWGATFELDEELEDGDSLTITPVASSVVDSGVDGSHLGFLRLSGRGDRIGAAMNSVCNGPAQVEILRGDSVVRSATITNTADFDLLLPLSVFSAYVDIEYSSAGVTLVQTLRFRGSALGEICVGENCVAGDGVRVSTVCNDGTPGVYYALDSVEVAARGIAGFGAFATKITSSVLDDGIYYTALGNMRLDLVNGGRLEVANLNVSGFGGVLIEPAVLADEGSGTLEQVAAGIRWADHDGAGRTSGLATPSLEVSACFASDSKMAAHPDARASFLSFNHEAGRWAVIATDWDFFAYDSVLRALSDGSPTFESAAYSGESVLLAGEARLSGVSVGSSGICFRFDGTLEIVDRESGDRAPCDELQFAWEDAPSGGLSNARLVGQDIAVILLENTPPAADVFRRGDTDGNGKVELSDAVRSLAFLFQGGPAPACDDAADSNDDGQHDIGDGINTLNALFLGTGEIPAPGPAACGVDPTTDSLSCGAYDSCP